MCGEVKELTLFYCRRLLELRKYMKDEYTYQNYLIYPKTGQVFNKETKNEIASGKVNIAITLENNRRLIYKKSKFIWEVVNGKTVAYGDVFVAKNGEETDCRIDNSQIVERKNYFKDHDWGMKVKLTEAQCKAMKKDFEKGDVTNVQLALKYKCSKSTVQKVLSGNYYYDIQKRKQKTS